MKKCSAMLFLAIKKLRTFIFFNVYSKSVVGKCALLTSTTFLNLGNKLWHILKSYRTGPTPKTVLQFFSHAVYIRIAAAQDCVASLLETRSLLLLPTADRSVFFCSHCKTSWVKSWHVQLLHYEMHDSDSCVLDIELHLCGSMRKLTCAFMLVLSSPSYRSCSTTVMQFPTKGFIIEENALLGKPQPESLATSKARASEQSRRRRGKKSFAFLVG